LKMKNFVFFGLVFVCLFSVCLAYGADGDAAERMTVGLVYFEDKTNDPNMSYWRYLSHQVLGLKLYEVKSLKLSSEYATEFAFKKLGMKRGEAVDAQKARRIGEIIEARRVVFGSYAYSDKKWVLEACVVSTASGKVSEKIRAESGDWFDASSDLLKQVLKMKNFVFFGLVFVCLFSVCLAYGANGNYFLDKCYILMADIDVMDIEMGPIGDTVEPFSGCFDGNGHAISNLTINITDSNDIGFFGYIKSRKIYSGIKNLNLVNITIAGKDNVGGLVGSGISEITNCSVNGSVTGNNNVGGMVGSLSGNNSKISRCFSKCDVDGNDLVGGVIGCSDVEISNCYSNGFVIGNSSVGGLAGYNDHRILYSYSTGPVTGIRSIGGLIGNNNKFVHACFWDVESSGLHNGRSGTGLNTAEMQKVDTFSYADWGNGSWTIAEDADYPRLVWENVPGVEILNPDAFSGGVGTESDPYQITSGADLQLINSSFVFMDKHFILMADLDLSGVEMSPIGSDTQSFEGVFDGNGHVISNLAINLPGSNCVGLFGYLTGEVKNLGLADVSIAGNWNVGGLIGYCNEGIIHKCFVSGEVRSEQDCIGGLVGYFEEGSISQCFSSGMVSSDGHSVGGLIGWVRGGIIEDSYSRAEVNARQYNGGGFAGYTQASPEITRCYSVGKLKRISTSNYYSGFANTDFLSLGLNWAVGCFWDIDTSEITNSRYGTGLNTVFMKSMSIYQHTGWSGDVWTIDEGNDYPRLAWENKPGVPIAEQIPVFEEKGTSEDPYVISNVKDLMMLCRNSALWNDHLILTSDLDVDGLYVTPIGYYRGHSYTNDFSGVFDGGGHVISNLSMGFNVYSSLGLFGYVGFGGEIKRLGLENVSVINNVSPYSTGGLAGLVEGGIISECYTKGEVRSSNKDVDTGGLVGRTHGGLYSVVIRDCYSHCSVTGDSKNCGGLGGSLSGSEVVDCYSTGLVDAGSQSSYAQGLVGYASPWTVIASSFWDVETSGVVESTHGESMTTDEMQTVSTFTDAGWDFVGESVNGDSDVWRLCVDGSGYPRLAWEFTSRGDFVCGDGVDMSDFGYLAGRYGSEVDIDQADLDGDGVVGILDVAEFCLHWLE